jgi:hypothetical protein
VIHHLKCENPWFGQIWNRGKTFEVRRCDDRTFKVGDYLFLYEYDKELNEFSSEMVEAEVTSIYETKIPIESTRNPETGYVLTRPGVIMSFNPAQIKVKHIAWPAKCWREGQNFQLSMPTRGKIE